jgi:predicted Ser/Thr protein kinase
LEARASGASSDLEGALGELDVLSRSYLDGSDFGGLSSRRKALLSRASSRCAELSDLRHRHRIERERMDILNVVSAVGRAMVGKGVDAREAGDAFTQTLGGAEFEEGIGRLMDRAHQAFRKDEAAFKAAEKSFRAKRLLRLTFALLLPLLAAAAAFAHRRKRPGVRAGDLLQGCYRIDRELPRSGSGRVFACTDEALGRRVALKLLREDLVGDPRRREVLLDRSRAAAALKHPNIAEIYAIFQEAGRVFLVEEFVEGKALGAFLDEGRPLPWEVLMSVVRQSALALDFAHARGIVHGDLKPSDVVLGPDGSVKILDFAISHAARRLAREAARTPFQAPESLGDPPGPPCDVFSLGALLAAMAEGAGPVAGLAGVVGKATSGDPAGRQRSAGELCSDVESLRGAGNSTIGGDRHV